jgi:TRAP-type transport system periplasmic protein
MKKSFKVVSLLLSVALAGVMLTGCGGSSTKADGKVEKKVIKVGIGLNDQSPQYKGLEKFKEIVERESKGRLEVNIFANAQLGDDIKMMTQLRAGTLEMTVPSSSPISSLDKKWMVFDLPFLFPNEEVVDKVLDGPIGQKFLDSLSQYGIKGLGYYENGYRQITNSIRPIKVPEDLKGMKIRTMENPVHLATFRKLGTNPSPMPFSEVFTALQQKTIDGQENPSTTNYLQKFYEVQKYNTISNHFYTPFVSMYSKKSWDTLSKEDQDIILKATKESSVYQRKYNREMMKESVAGMEKNGTLVTILTPEEQKGFMDATKDISAQFESEIGASTVQEVKAEIAKYFK